MTDLTITDSSVLQKPLARLWQVINLERREIGAIYFYSILNGLLQLSVPIGVQAIINFVLAGSLSTSMIVLIFLVVLGVFMSGLMQINQMRIIEKIQQRIFARYSFEFAYRIPKLDLKSVDGYYLPELVNRFFDTVAFQKGLNKLLLDIPIASVQIIFGLVLLSLYNSIFIFFSIFLVALLWAIIYFTSAKGLRTSLLESDYKYAVAGWLEELARVAKSFHFSRSSSLSLSRTDEYVTGYLEARTSHFRILKLQYWTLVIFKVLITAAMLIVGGVLLVQQQINVGQFIAAEIVIITVLTSVEKMIASLDKVYDVLTSVEKLGKVIDKPLEKNGTLKLNTGQKGISVSMEEVCFGYHKDNDIINNISFSAPSGTKLCIMGNDGSGKSTILKLLTGAYNDFEGSITINEVPVGNYNIDSIRSETGILFTQQDLFHGSLLENITLGQKEILTEEIVELANAVGLTNFILSLKDGFDTLIDPTGRRLSKGVIQKTLLLRALVASPHLLLLEEPWQGLEEPVQQSIKKYLINKTPGVTVLVASNDESFARQCQHIIIIKDGTIIKQGNPSEIF
ncbi:MAG: ATP-binding cassette domain-containing protein [Sphingobacteriales bacterium]|nr:ATP-binding cassette domain-containing protein [Sphingobacteriales bacterium]MBI3719746.1 ATP-binding cassette domain-containing protein [Sphingobacteriales bacterium]